MSIVNLLIIIHNILKSSKCLEEVNQLLFKYI